MSPAASWRRDDLPHMHAGMRMTTETGAEARFLVENKPGEDGLADSANASIPHRRKPTSKTLKHPEGKIR